MITREHKRERSGGTSSWGGAFRLVSVAFLLVLVTTACTGDGSEESGESGEKVTVTAWFGSEEIGRFETAFETAFESANPDIDLEITGIPGNNYIAKLDSAVAAEDVPDIGMVYSERWLKAGFFRPIDAALEAEGVDLSEFPSALLDYCRWPQPGGDLLCVGSYRGFIGTFFNKDMFDDAGIPYPSPTEGLTVSELHDIACRLTDADEERWGVALGDPWTWSPWELWWSPDGHQAVGYMNSEQTVSTYEQVVQIFRDGCAPSPSAFDPWTQGADMFAQGQLAMVVTDFLSIYKIENAGINYDFLPPPTADGLTPWSYTWWESVGVMCGAEHPEEAARVLAFLATEGQRLRAEVTKDPPASDRVLDEVDFVEGQEGREEAFQAYRVATARTWPFVPDRFDTLGPLGNVFPEATSGELSVEQALDTAAGRVQENMDDAWDRWENVPERTCTA